MKVNKKNVVALRSLQSWSQEDLAAAAGVSVRTVQRMESLGVSSLETVRSIASAFDVVPEDILESEVVLHRLDKQEKIYLILKLAGKSMLISYPLFLVLMSMVFLVSFKGWMNDMEAMLYIGIIAGAAGCYSFVVTMRKYYEETGYYNRN